MLAGLLAQETGAALLRVSVPGWMPSGAHNRAVAETITTIIEHISTHPRSIIFLNELDKLHWNDASWCSYIKCELFEILDGRLPSGAKLVGDEDEDGLLTGSQLVRLTEKLCSSTFVIGAGTFQEHYESQSCFTKIGFHLEQNSQPKSGPSPDNIAKKIPRELLNRFNSTLLFLPALEPAHYKLIAEQAEKSLPAWIRSAFQAAAANRIEHAIAAQSGCRFVEEALADALKWTKAPTPEPQIEEPDLCDW